MNQPIYGNGVSTNNLPISDYLSLDPLKTDNLPLSDETSVSADTVADGTSTYSVNKRKATAATQVTSGILLTLSVSAIAGGSILTNSFLGTQPTVDAPSYVLDGDTLSYDVNVTNKGTMKVYLLLLEEKKETERVDLSKTGRYQGRFTLLGGFTYTAQIEETNHMDFRKVLYTDNFTTQG